MIPGANKITTTLGWVICLLLAFRPQANAQQQRAILSGQLWAGDQVQDSSGIQVTAQHGATTFRAISNREGRFTFGSIPLGSYKVFVATTLYTSVPKNIHLEKDLEMDLEVKKAMLSLNEVHITASEDRGMTSSSVIDRKAMQHLQPSSFTDLLELLPGGRAKDPVLTGVNQIRLRETGTTKSGYDISSLGTAFVIDGAPVNTGANLQSVMGFGYVGDRYSSKDASNIGVDMRTISTDQIEKVTIVRGIPSVEYGDLTSGLVQIERKKGASPYYARFKADGFSKLISLSKGFNLSAKNMTLNTDFGFLDAKSSPTNSFNTYKRINASARLEKLQQNERRRLKWNAAFDFATNIDNQRTDPDNGYAATDKYISTYNSYGVQGGVQSTRLKPGLVKSWGVTGSLSYQPAKIDLVQWVQTRSAYILFNAMEAGEHDARYVTPSYAGKMLVDGKPLYAFLKAKTTLGFRTGQLRHKLMLGVESNYSKNFGRGQVYDVDFPVSSTTPVNQRPRTFDSIPGMWNQSFFAQDEISVYVGPHKLTAAGGLRGMMLAGMDSRYAIANKMYVDPRLNLRWKLPLANMGSKQLEVTIGAGYGLHTKMPTLDQLYPAPVFRDIVQLNFFHNNPEFRRANVVTYIMDESNPNLKPARNNKFEVNADFEVDGNRLSVTVFNEDMHTGFTTNSRYMSLSYKKYDPQSVDAANLTSPPQTSDFSYVEKHQLYNYNIAVNGSRLRKQGVEYQFSTKRFKGVNTRFTVNGAWFRSTYNSSLPTHALISSDYLVNGEVAQLAGIYSDPTGETRQYMNTNLVIDSYLPKLGVTISSSIQTVLFRTQQNTQKSGVPSAYVDANGVTHPYTKESELDADLKLLKMFYSATEAVVDRVPMSLQANLKMTKEFRKTAAMSLFVNRLFTYGVNYYNKNNVYIKQNTYTTPYFGAEVTFNF